MPTVVPNVPLVRRHAPKASTGQRNMRHTPTRNGVEQAVCALQGNHQQPLARRAGVRDWVYLTQLCRE